MEIRWSPEAADDLERIVRHIQKDSPEAAHRVAEEIFNGATSLQTFPHRGRRGLYPGSRELIIRPYILAYRVRGDVVEIARIYHSAQDWPPST